MGYGAMQLAGPGVFGPPKDRAAALAVLREAVASGVDHIDTSDFYGPHVTNQIIREALHPYPDDLVIVTKVGARRGEDAPGSRRMSRGRARRSAVHDNLRNLGLDALDVVNLRIMGDIHGAGRGLDRGAVHGPRRAAAAGPRPPYRPEQRHRDAGRRGAQDRADRLRAEPLQPRPSRRRRADRRAGGAGIAYVPFFPLGGFTPLQSSRCRMSRAELGATPMQVALAWLLHRAPNILLIPGTSSRGPSAGEPGGGVAQASGRGAGEAECDWEINIPPPNEVRGRWQRAYFTRDDGGGPLVFIPSQQVSGRV